MAKLSPILALALVACGSSEAGPSAIASADAGSASSDAGSTSNASDASTGRSSVRPSRGCTAPKRTPGTEASLTLQHDGIERAFLLKVGRTIAASTPTPLWIDWHGLGSNATEQKAYSGSAKLADERGFVVAFPNGLGNSLNGGVCCSQLGEPPHEADDVGFGRAIVELLGGELCLDLNRVYSLGMSNGGYMSEYNACTAADLYAAVAPVSALGAPQPRCSPSRPVPMIAFNGTDDPTVPYSGSRASVASWRTRNGCTGDPVRVDHGASYCETWTCGQATELTSCTVTGMNHCWPGNPLTIPGYCESGGLADIDATKTIADFFDRFRLPGR